MTSILVLLVVAVLAAWTGACIYRAGYRDGRRDEQEWKPRVWET